MHLLDVIRLWEREILFLADSFELAHGPHRIEIVECAVRLL